MASEPIDIEVRDKVATTISAKLLDIATAALQGYTNIGKLNEALALSSSAQATAAAASLATAQDKVGEAVERTSTHVRKAKSDLNAFGESQAEVEARLKGVAAAAVATANAQAAAGAAAVRAAGQEQTLTNALRGNGAAVDDAAKRYTNYMSALNTIKPDVGIPKAARDTIDDAEKKTGKLGETTVGVKREVLVLGHEFVSGNFSRIPGSLLVLAERTGGIGGAIQLLTSAFTPLNIVIGLAAIAVVVFEKALFAAEAETRHFNDAINVTQNAAGLTIDSFHTLNEAIAKNNNVTISSTRSVSSALVESGRFQKEQVEQLTDATIKFSKLTGESTDKIVQDFIHAADGPAAYADKLFKQFAFISPAQLNHIRELDKMGQQAEATKLLSQGLYDYLNQKAPEALTGLSGFWNNLKVSIDGAFESVKTFANSADMNKLLRIVTTVVPQLSSLRGFVPDGPSKVASPGEQLKDVQSQIDQLKKASDVGASYGDSNNAGIQTQLKALEQQKTSLTDIVYIEQQQAKAQSDNTAQIKLSGAALELLDSKYESTRGNAYKMTQEITAFRKSLEQASQNANAATDPRYQYAKANQSKIEEEIRRKYRDQTPLRTPETPEESRSRFLDKINGQLDLQIKYYDQISEIRGAQRKADEVDVQLANKRVQGKTVAPLSNAERQQIVDKQLLVEVNKRISQQEDSLYNQSDVVKIRNYNEAVDALTNLRKNDILSAEQTADAQRKLNYEFGAAMDPLFLFNKGISDQTALLQFNSRERVAQAALQSEQNRLLTSSGKQLNPEQSKSILDQTRSIQHLSEVTSELDSIYAQTQGAQQKLATELEATNIAFAKGDISVDAYRKKIVDVQVATANLNLSNGVGTFEDSVISSLGRIREGFTNVTKGLTDSFGTFFKGVTDGFANSIGHAIVYGDSLRDSLRQVSQSALAELISSLIKVGIQYVVNAALGDAALATSTAAQVAAAQVVALAWAEPAALVSLATLGANAVPATGALAETSAFSLALATLKPFAAGGYTGDYGVSQIAGIVHGQEFVTNAAATTRNRSTLEAMNRGETVGNSGGVVVHNYGTPQAYKQDGVDNEGRMRLIARDVVATDTPGVISRDLQNPNSRTSKTLAQTHNISRKR